MFTLPSKLKAPKKPEKLSKDDEFIHLAKQDSYTVIDIETSGLSPKVGGEIIELAAVKVIRGRVVDTYDTLIQPENPIYKKTTQITGITNQDLKGQPSLHEAIDRLVAFMGSSTLVAHNAAFEQLFLNHAFKQFGYAPKNEWLCTMKLFRYLYPERKKLKLGAKLDDATEFYGISFTEEEHHRALPDTKVTAEVLLEMRKELLDADYIQAELLQDTHYEEEVIEEDKVDTFYITNARYWEKCYNKKRDKWARRLYVNFSSEGRITGSVYYDLYAKSWVVKECQDKLTKETFPVDLKKLEEAFLEKVDAPSVRGYLKRQGVFKKARRYLDERTKDKASFVRTAYPGAAVGHEGYNKATIPYDVFIVKENKEHRVVYVTNEKRGSRYRLFDAVDAIN